ncbi:MAG: MerR family DNA-binding transcriptional regulator [Saccharospirillaceae bacterium]|jgi:DNA-binding transcriptional MerR regulator|nr:MerR family transcriptional regulator [Thalassolituus sp. HI0120]MCH2041893.1 MerR family DNA-binding transcriptional regulator [Saccharospirillaceae bacterium]
MSQTYSIRDLADEFDITTRTIRFYEAEGMLQPRREGQTRIYSPQDRVTLKLILRGKRLGLSLAQSRELIEMYAPGETPDANRPQLEKLLAVIEDRRAHLRQQLHDIERMMEDLDDAELKAREALS